MTDERCFCHITDSAGNTYVVKDKEAREKIQKIIEGIIPVGEDYKIEGSIVGTNLKSTGNLWVGSSAEIKGQVIIGKGAKITGVSTIEDVDETTTEMLKNKIGAIDGEDTHLTGTTVIDAIDNNTSAMIAGKMGTTANASKILTPTNLAGKTLSNTKLTGTTSITDVNADTIAMLKTKLGVDTVTAEKVLALFTDVEFVAKHLKATGNLWIGSSAEIKGNAIINKILKIANAPDISGVDGRLNIGGAVDANAIECGDGGVSTSGSIKAMDGGMIMGNFAVTGTTTLIDISDSTVEMLKTKLGLS